MHFSILLRNPYLRWLRGWVDTSLRGQLPELQESWARLLVRIAFLCVHRRKLNKRKVTKIPTTMFSFFPGCTGNCGSYHTAWDGGCRVKCMWWRRCGRADPGCLKYWTKYDEGCHQCTPNHYNVFKCPHCTYPSKGKFIVSWDESTSSFLY